MLLIDRIMNLSVTEIYRNLVGKQFTEFEYTHNSKTAEVSVNKYQDVSNPFNERTVFSVQARCPFGSASLG